MSTTKERGGALWMAQHTFGEDAVASVVPAPSDRERRLSKVELEAIARCSTRAFWANERTLFGRDPKEKAPDVRRLSALEALREFGFARLYQARERGGAALV